MSFYHGSIVFFCLSKATEKQSFRIKVLIKKLNKVFYDLIFNILKKSAKINSTIVNNANPVLFDSWKEYQLKLLFTFWNVTTPTQFGLSCCGIFLSCILLNYMCLLLKFIEYKMLYTLASNAETANEEKVHLVFKKSIPRPTICLGIGYFFSAIPFYCLFIMLALIATTLNPWIFISLVLGYSVGSTLTLSHHLKLKMDYNYK